MSEPTATPQPAPAMAPSGPAGMELASYGDRFIAFLIDLGVFIVAGIIFAVMSFALGKVLGGLGTLIVTLLNLAFSLGYFPYLWGVDNPITGRGQSIGKKVMNIKIVKEDGSDIGLGDAILRFIGYIVSEIVIFLGFVWIFIDDNNQGWHDKIAKTYVVKA